MERNRKPWLLLATLCLVLSVVTVAGVSEERYSNVGALLELGTGARPMGMGGAFVGLADDENAVAYNPAALAFLDEFGLTSLWSPQFGLLDYGGVGVAGKYIGLTASVLYSGLISVPNEFGVDTGDSFSYVSSDGTLGFGLPLSSWLSVGGRFKYYYSHLSLTTFKDGFGWAVEPAILVREGNFGFGVVAENVLSNELDYGANHREELVKKLRAGFSFTSGLDEGLELTLLADLETSFASLSQGDYSSMIPHLGAELWASQIGVRAGYDGSALTLGSSVDLVDVRLDWAYAGYRTGIEGTHRVSLTYRF